MKKIVLLLIIIIVLGIFIHTIKVPNTNRIESEIVSDVTPPVLEIEKDKVILAVGNEFNKNVKATDDVDGDISDKVTVEGNIDTSKEGTYEIKYVAQDSSGNKAEKNQEVEVRKKLENGLPVLMYHFFYSKDDPNYAGKTPDNNVLMVEKFTEQMDYLLEDNFYFPTWQEVEDYVDGKINLPEKSVVITDDDGNHTFFALAVPVIEERKIPVTSFVITGWYEERLDEKYEYVNYQSHSDDMHKSGASGKGAMVNWNYTDIVNDLNNSKNKIESHTGKTCNIFCYPFGHYNDTAFKALEDTGYNLAFTVEGGKVKPGLNKLKLPRVRVNGNTSLTEFKNSVK